ncbi:MAG: DUF3842 family protein [Clostridia bacterium]|nr:DUF3842 family protein [Clostridia bacterium]
MKLLVIDGQGGGMGRSLVQMLKTVLPGQSIVAVGTNAAATAAMLRAGADVSATGENAVIYHSRQAEIILGPLGILCANAMQGEISPAMAAAVSASQAQKVLLPMERCGVHVVGVIQQTLEAAIAAAVEKARTIGLAGVDPLFPSAD